MPLINRKSKTHLAMKLSGAFVMLITIFTLLFATSAYASTGNYSIGSNDYDTLKEAIDSVAPGGTATIVLNKNVNDASEPIVPVGKTITLDTNGKIITKSIYGIVNRGTLNIIGGGKITTAARKNYIFTLQLNNNGRYRWFNKCRSIIWQ